MSSESRSWRLRPARPDDYDAIVTVWTRSGLPTSPRGRDRREAFLVQLAHFPTSYVVATVKEQIVGVVLGTHDARKGWINRLAVLPEYQRRGVAADLIRAAEAALRDEGIDIVAALVEPDNLPSAELFRRMGYLTDVEVLYFRKRAHPDV